ncbi:hypothetical protein [Methanoculleus sp.]|nr:hypothetical protein [Methanoculleus sp.]MCK9318911.1 hypothetical protein [Methanoculleus sp.]
MNKKNIEVKNDKVEIKIDFQLVWSFMWRWIVIVMGTSFVAGLIISVL